MYSSVIRKHGADALSFNDTKGDIVQKVIDAKPDLISLDTVISDKDGHEVARMLKEDSRTSSIPFVFLTNEGQESDIEKGKRAGALEYFVLARDIPSEVVETMLSLCVPNRA